MAQRKGLDYVINLIDQVTSPVKNIAKEIDALGQRGKAAMEQIAFGAAAIVATGMAMKSALNPAIEMSNAVSNIAATGMGEEGLAKIEKFALGFSSTFGVAATDVVDSANEIVRAIDGLTDEEVIAFTKSSNILAKATGSNVQEMGSYLSTMYGIFQKEADRVGKAQWIEKMSAQATLTANMFKSSGESLSQAFTNLMSTGEAKGVALAEQFAVLGNLQSVMPGGMSGTKYAAFLKGVGKAQKALGLNFLDSQNRMRSMPEILTEIKKCYGETIDEVESLELSKAFGTADAVSVINYMLPKIDSLKNNIKQIGDLDNLDDAIAISHIVTDVWERFAQILNNIWIVIGGQVLKKITPLLNKIADAGTYFVKWLEVNKNIARLIGYIVGVALALSAVVPAVMLVVGVFKMWTVGMAALLLPLKLIFSPLLLIVGVIFILRKHILAFLKGVIDGFLSWGISFEPIKKGLNALKEAVQPIINLLAKLFGLTAENQSNFTAWGNAGKVVGGVLAAALQFIFNLFQRVAYYIANAIKGFMQWGVSVQPLINAVSRLWNVFSDLFQRILQVVGLSEVGGENLELWANAGQIFGNLLAQAFQLIIDIISLLIEWVATLGEVLIGAIQGGIETWNSFFELLSSGNVLGAFVALAEGIWNIFTGIFKKIGTMMLETINWIIDKINKFTGTSFEPIKIPMELETAQMPNLNATEQISGISNNAAFKNPVELETAQTPYLNIAKPVGSVSNSALTVGSQPVTTASLPPPKTAVDRNKTVANALTQSSKNITQHNTININASGLNEQQARALINQSVTEKIAMGA